MSLQKMLVGIKLTSVIPPLLSSYQGERLTTVHIKYMDTYEKLIKLSSIEKWCVRDEYEIFYI